MKINLQERLIKLSITDQKMGNTKMIHRRNEHGQDKKKFTVIHKLLWFRKIKTASTMALLFYGRAEQSKVTH